MDYLEKIKQVEKASGNEKLTILKSLPELKMILKYAYDPFKKYYMTPPENNGVFGGTNFTIETKQLLDDLSNRVITGNDAIQKVCNHMSTLNPESAIVLHRILSKDLRCGINIKTINKAFPGLIPLVWNGSIKPPFALCKTFEPKKAKYPLLVGCKKDGVRAQHVDKLISRQGQPFIGHDHLESALNTNLDGEICVPGMEFNAASGKIRDNNSTPESVFWVFDAPSVPGTKIERYKWLVKNLDVKPGTMGPNGIGLIKLFTVKNEQSLMALYKATLAEGEEGLVLYDPNSEYEDGRIWWRLVPIKSEDLKVIDFFEGKGKHAGSLGGIIVEYKGKSVRVGTGFSEKILARDVKKLINPNDIMLLSAPNKKLLEVSLDSISPMWLKIRQFIWDNKDLFLGRIAKIEYKEKTPHGSLRHPRFKDWRFDK